MHFITTLLTEKPILGYIGAAGGAVSGLLTWLQILTPVVGFVAAVFGMVAGFFVMLIKAREWWRGSRVNPISESHTQTKH